MTEKVASEILSLPMYPQLEAEQQQPWSKRPPSLWLSALSSRNVFHHLIWQRKRLRSREAPGESPNSLITLLLLPAPGCCGALRSTVTSGAAQMAFTHDAVDVQLCRTSRGTGDRPCPSHGRMSSCGLPAAFVTLPIDRGISLDPATIMFNGEVQKVRLQSDWRSTVETPVNGFFLPVFITTMMMLILALMFRRAPQPRRAIFMYAELDRRSQRRGLR